MKKYQIIYADPPWRQFKGGKKAVRPNSSGEPLPYNVISLEEIDSILKEAFQLTEENSVLFLWTIDKYLFEAQQLAEKYGYKLHARMVWNKVTGIPAAFTIRYGHEYLLYMYRGKLTPVAPNERGKIHSVFTEQVKEHSRKPDIAYEIIERLYPNTERLELFARRKRQTLFGGNWDVWGNEVESDIDLTPLNQ
jgi:N6-adenosine-specific RNA methylase IME4